MKLRRLLQISLISLAFAGLALAGDKACSNSTLQGSFGYTVTGFAPGNVPFAAVGRIVFDGSGGLTTTRTLSSGGTIVQHDKVRDLFIRC